MCATNNRQYQHLQVTEEVFLKNQIYVIRMETSNLYPARIHKTAFENGHTSIPDL